MTQKTETFPIQDKNRVRRRYNRANYDKKAVYDILDSHALCHLSYVIDEQPYCTPTTHWREGDTLYWHGSSASRMQKHLEKGAAVCLTVSHLDGFVLARSGFHHSAEYRSAMCFGKTRLIDDEQEKESALIAMIERLFPNRNDLLRPITKSEIKQTSIIAMAIDTAVTKTRNDGVKDDEEDYALPVWAGVIALKTVISDIKPCPRLAKNVVIPNQVKDYESTVCLDDILLKNQSQSYD